MAWIFQGNPTRYDIDEYVARFPELVYWSVNRYATEIAVGDRAYIWRSGPESGVIASGHVVESPVQAAEVLHPDNLGEDLWVHSAPSSDALRVGLAFDSVRLTVPEGMVSRVSLREDELLADSSIIKMPNGTVFRLDERESVRLENMWSQGFSEDDLLLAVPAAEEGRPQLVAHRRRERSRLLVSRKRASVRAANGVLMCELCGLSESSIYPEGLAESVFEVHHRVPLSAATAPRRTVLEDLAVVCANCHRAVHANRDVEGNFEALARAFAQ